MKTHKSDYNIIFGSFIFNVNFTSDFRLQAKGSPRFVGFVDARFPQKINYIILHSWSEYIVHLASSAAITSVLCLVVSEARSWGPLICSRNGIPAGSYFSIHTATGVSLFTERG